jgi:hypothetical protein
VKRTFTSAVFPLSKSVQSGPPYLFIPGVIFIVVVLCASGFTSSVSFSGTVYPSFQDFGVVSADLDRDGLPDMAIAGGAIISVFLATSPGKFGAEADYSLPGFNNPNNLLAADFKWRWRP